jgi:hypothetical protein
MQASVAGVQVFQAKRPSVVFDLPASRLRSSGLFYLNCGAVNSNDGRTILIERDSLLAVEVNAAGTIVSKKSVGGQASGEIGSCVFANWIGPQLWVSDIRLSRITLFGPNLTTGSSYLVHFQPANGTGDAYVRALIDSIDVLLEYSEPSSADVAASPLQLPVVRNSYRNSGSPADTITVIEMHHRRLVLKGVNRVLYLGFQPWSDDPLITVSPRSDLLVRVDRRIAHAGKRGAVSVTVFDMKGEQLSKWAYIYQPSLLPQAVVRKVLGRQAHAVGWHPALSDSAKAFRWLAERVFRPRYAPEITEVFVGADSTIWLRHFPGPSIPQDSALWTLHDPKGGRLGKLLLPAMFSPLGADSKTVTGVYLSDNALVTGVVRFRF